MSARTRAIIGVSVMSVLLVLYFVFAGVRALALLATGTPIAVAMGVALLVLPLIGVWALWREVKFGRDATALVDELDARALLPDDLGEVSAMGRPNREVSDAVFPKYRRAAEENSESWESWMRLGVVYDASGDRKRARSAIRQAIQLKKQNIMSISAID